MTNTTDSNVQNVTVNNSANSDSSTNVEYSQNFVQVNPKKKPAPIKIVIPVVILCVLAAVLIAPLIDIPENESDSDDADYFDESDDEADDFTDSIEF